MLGCRHFARMFSLRLGWHILKLLANVVGSKTDKVFEIRLKHSTIFAIVNTFWPLHIWLNMIQVSNQQHVLCSLSMILSMYSWSRAFSLWRLPLVSAWCSTEILGPQWKRHSRQAIETARKQLQDETRNREMMEGSEFSSVTVCHCAANAEFVAGGFKIPSGNLT